jgi:hypothetical protein
MVVSRLKVAVAVVILLAACSARSPSAPTTPPQPSQPPPPGLWSMSGVGPQNFTVPSSIRKVDLAADFAGACQYFQVRFQAGWIVNTNLGDCTVHHLEGT